MSNELVTLIPTINAIKESADEQLKTENYKEAIELYENGLNYSSSFVYKNKGIISKDDVNRINTIKKEMMSSLAVCYYNLEEYDKCIEIDKGIISIDHYQHESYARLFHANMKLNLPYVAAEYGKFIEKDFNEKIKKTYKDIIDKLKEIEVMREKEKIKEATKIREKLKEKLYKMVIPMIVGALAGIYFYFYKKN